MGAWIAFTAGLGAGVDVTSDKTCTPASGAMGFGTATTLEGTLEGTLDDRSTFANDAATKTTLATKSKPSVRAITHLLLVFR